MDPMVKTKPYILLKHFSAQQIKAFGDYLKSPFFIVKPRAKMIKMLELFQRILENKNAAMSRQEFWMGMQPDKEFDPAALSRYLSEFLSYITDFLAIHQFQADRATQNWMSLHAIAMLNLETRPFYSFLNKYRKQMGTEADILSYHFRFLMQEEETSYLTRFQDRKKDPKLTDSLEALDTYYQLQRLKYFCAMLVDARISKRSDQLEMLGKWQDQLILSEDPLVQLFSQACLVLRNPGNDALFKDYLNLLDKHYKQYASVTLEQLYRVALNHAIHKLNLDQKGFLEMSAQLYKQILKNGLLFINGKIPKISFSNVVSIMCRARDYEWVEGFIRKYGDKIESQNDIPLTYNKAVLLYYQKVYHQALPLFNEVLSDKDDVFMSLDARIYMMRIYLEQGAESALNSLLESFRVFLRRQEINARRKKGYEAFHTLFKSFRKIYFSNTPTKAAAYQGLLTRLLDYDRVANRNWLKNRIEQEILREEF